MIDMQNYYMSKIAAPAKQDDIKTGFDKNKRTETGSTVAPPAAPEQGPLSASQSRMKSLNARKAAYAKQRGNAYYDREMKSLDNILTQRGKERDAMLNSTNMDKEDRARIEANYQDILNRRNRMRDKFDNAAMSNKDMSNVSYTDNTRLNKMRGEGAGYKAEAELIKDMTRAAEAHDKRYGGLGGRFNSFRDDSLNWGRGMLNSGTLGASNWLLNKSDYINDWSKNTRKASGDLRFLKEMGAAGSVYNPFNYIENSGVNNINELNKNIANSDQKLRFMDNKYLTPAQIAKKNQLNARRVAGQTEATGMESWGQGLTDAAMIATGLNGAAKSLAKAPIAQGTKAALAPVGAGFKAVAKPVTNVAGKAFPTFTKAVKAPFQAVNKVLWRPSKNIASGIQNYVNDVRIAAQSAVKGGKGAKNITKVTKAANNKALKEGKALIKQLTNKQKALMNAGDLEGALKTVDEIKNAENAIQVAQGRGVKTALDTLKANRRGPVGKFVNGTWKTGTTIARGSDANNLRKGEPGVFVDASQGAATDKVKGLSQGNLDTANTELKNAEAWKNARGMYGSDEETSKALGFTSDGKARVKPVGEYLSDIGSTIAAHPYISAAAAYMLYNMFSGGGGYQMGPMGGYQMGPQQGNIITRNPVLSTAAIGAGAGYLANEGAFGDNMKDWWSKLMSGTPETAKTGTKAAPLSEEAQAEARAKGIEGVEDATTAK